jgi:hypothetical protein
MHPDYPFDQYYIHISITSGQRKREDELMWQVFSRYGYDRNGYVLEGHIRQWLEALDAPVLDHLSFLVSGSTLYGYTTQEDYYHRFIKVLDEVLSDPAKLEEYTRKADASRIDKQGHGLKVMLTAKDYHYYHDGRYVPMPLGEVYTLERYTQTSCSTTFYLQECPGDSFNAMDFMEEDRIEDQKKYWQMVLQEDYNAYRTYYDVPEGKTVHWKVTPEEKQLAKFWLEKLDHFEQEVIKTGRSTTGRERSF